MKSHRTLATSLLIACGLAALVTAPAFAEGGDCGPMGGWEKFHDQRGERMQQHQKKLHDVLRLTPDQESAWKTFTESMRPPARADRPRPEEWTKLPAPERAEKMLELSKKHQERMTEHVAALKTFYAVLTPEQKKAFDDFHAGPGHRGGPRQSDGANSIPPAKG